MKNTVSSLTIGAVGTVFLSALLLAPPSVHAQYKFTPRPAPIAQNSGNRTTSARPSAPSEPTRSTSHASSEHSNAARQREEASEPSPSTHSRSTPVPSERPHSSIEPAAPLPKANTGYAPTTTRPTFSPSRENTQTVPESHRAVSIPSRNAMTTHTPIAHPLESRRSDGSRIVSTSRNRGYAERPISGRPGLVTRTYVAGGRSYARVFHTYSFHGVAYATYVPALYFHPWFYGWVYNPWPAPVTFAWGWYAAPWYGYYGAYFTPAPVYPTPALWVTDFLLAENLKLAYENQQQAGAPSPDGPTAALSPEVKALIADEVKQQIAAESDAAQHSAASVNEGTPPALDPTQRVFVVSMSLSVPVQNGQTCQLTPGDVILRSSDAISDTGKVGVSILSSKAGDCTIDSRTELDLATLQEMHNDFRQQIDSGLAVLAANQGKGGLPTGPAPAPRLAPDGQAQPDLDAADAVASLQKQATM